MREHFAKWASPNPGVVTRVTALSPEAISEKPCIDAVSPLSPLSPAYSNMLEKLEAKALTASMQTNLLEKRCDSGDNGGTLFSLNIPCHQGSCKLVTTVTVSLLIRTQCREVLAWPVETQRVFVGVLAHHEARGFGLVEAEALAYATVKELMRRNGGPVQLRPQPQDAAPEPERPAMPPEIAGLVDLAHEVFGPGLEAHWEPEPRWACYSCRGESFFINLGGQRVCARCHPPVRPDLFPVVQNMVL